MNCPDFGAKTFCSNTKNLLKTRYFATIYLRRRAGTFRIAMRLEFSRMFQGFSYHPLKS